MPDSTSRTIEHEGPGPVTLDLQADTVFLEVLVDEVDQAVVTLSPAQRGDATAADLIARARARSSRDRLTINLPRTSGSGGGSTTVISTGGAGFVQTSVANHGSVVVQTGGDMYVAGRRIVHASGPVTIVNGQVITGSGVTVVDGGGIRIVARLPHGSSLESDITAGTVATRGQLHLVRHQSTSAGLQVEAAVEVEATGTSGDVRVDQAEHVEAESTSGSIRIGASFDVRARSMSGNVTVAALSGTARVKTMSGNVRVHAVTDGRVEAKAMSGNVTVTQDLPSLHVQVAARSMSGRVSTPNR
jgi:Putative adhesin